MIAGLLLRWGSGSMLDRCFDGWMGNRIRRSQERSRSDGRIDLCEDWRSLEVTDILRRHWWHRDKDRCWNEKLIQSGAAFVRVLD